MSESGRESESENLRLRLPRNLHIELPRNLHFKVHLSAAPATKSALRGSPSAPPATKSALRGSPNAVPATKSGLRGSPSAAPSTKSTLRGSPTAVPATKCAHRGSQSAVPATKSANEPHVQKSRFTAPVTKSGLLDDHHHVQSAISAVPATKTTFRSKTALIPCTCHEKSNLERQNTRFPLRLPQKVTTMWTEPQRERSR